MTKNVAVWDTYVKKKNGNVLHFDIIVPEEMEDENVIYRFGKKYLAEVGEADSELNLKQCQFCHIEEPTEEMLRAIEEKGFYILEMEEIPKSLPENPTRRQMILFLRGHFDEYRFANFKGVSEDEVKEFLKKKQVKF